MQQYNLFEEQSKQSVDLRRMRELSDYHIVIRALHANAILTVHVTFSCSAFKFLQIIEQNITYEEDMQFLPNNSLSLQFKMPLGSVTVSIFVFFSK